MRRSRKNIHTMTPELLAKVRRPDSPCACGHPASRHVNHLGQCAEECNCERWSWDGKTLPDGTIMEDDSWVPQDSEDIP